MRQTRMTFANRFWHDREGHPSLARVFDDPQAVECRCHGEEGLFNHSACTGVQKRACTKASGDTQALYDIFDRIFNGAYSVGSILIGR